MKSYRLFLLLVAFLFSMMAQAQPTVITIRADSAKQTINRNIYGHFAEHLGRSIYGGFFVGDTSQIANTNGVRNDVVAALRKLKIPVLRWPGGCFADTYHWKDGIGAKEKRPTMVNKWWGGVTEDNSFGTHDFLNMCKLLGAEPYLAGNVGSGTVQELADWVQYVNFDGVSPMSNLRKQNGENAPWHVKYWGVGNEAWGCGGEMKPDYYANEYRKFAVFMTDYDNDMMRIASGANSDDYNWTETLMKNIPLYQLGGIALHHYSVNWNHKSSATGFTEAEYFDIIKRALFMDTLVMKHSAIMNKYDPQKKVALVVDEWGGWYDVEPGTNPGFLYQQNTMRDAMIAGVTLNIFNNHSDRVRMACLAQCINVLQAVILTDKEKMILTPTYHVMEMYNVHQDAKMLPVSVQTGNYVLGNEKLPAVSCSASKDSAGKTHISLVNIDAKNKQTITLHIDGATFKNLTGRILTSARINDHNTFEQPNTITPKAFTGAALKGNDINLKLPPFSVVVLELQ